MAMYTAIGIGASFALFVTIRSFAGSPPHTMNREWEEATNEYLKVRYNIPFLASQPLEGLGMDRNMDMRLICLTIAVRKSRAHHRYLIPRI